MKFPQLLFAFFFSLSLPGLAWAAVDVTSNELQQSADIVLPGEDALQLEGYGRFSLENEGAYGQGIRGYYESENASAQVLVYSYQNQDSAHYAFENLLPEDYFEDANKMLLQEDSRWIYYESEAGVRVDAFGTISTYYPSIHVIHVNGNLIYQASLMYPDAGSQSISTTAMLKEAIRSSKLSLGVLYPPRSAEFSLPTKLSSVTLSADAAIPLHGSLALDFYVSNAELASGTILDSSGLSTAEAGDIYLYLNEDGRLFAGIYAPGLSSNCNQQAGWYRIETNNSAYAYEWNEVAFSYGAGGFSLQMNGGTRVSCDLTQGRSERDLYLGDFPGDFLEEGMMGYVNDVHFTASVSDSGEAWDALLTDPLFTDLAVNDPDVAVFHFLNEAGVFTGSNGFLYPDAVLNRAEMVKVLLTAFNRTEVGSALPLSDVDETDWYYPYVRTAYAIGMVQGTSDGRFLGTTSINRAEFYTMLLRLSEGSYGGHSFLDVDRGDWYWEAAQYAAENDFVTGMNFDPSAKVSRREAARVLYALMLY